jgi:hypothetical protein
MDGNGLCRRCGWPGNGEAHDLDEALASVPPATETAVSTATIRKCGRHTWAVEALPIGVRQMVCVRCGKTRDPIASRRGKNNGKRGRAEELTVARAVGGRKVGPMGYPWDVEMPGYARLGVKKLATPPSLRFIAAELARIALAPGPEMPGFVWVEPGRGGERLIIFRAKDFAERHGTPVEEPE